MSGVRTLRELIAEHAVADNPEATAKGVEDDLDMSLRQVEVLHRLIVNEVQRWERENVRAVEPRGERPTTAPELLPRTPARVAYLSKRFAIGDGRFVVWGEATVADHEARLSMLRQLASGINRTISDHVNAIEQIRSTPGATCLFDVYRAKGDAA